MTQENTTIATYNKMLEEVNELEQIKDPSREVIERLNRLRQSAYFFGCAIERQMSRNESESPF